MRKGIAILVVGCLMFLAIAPLVAHEDAIGLLTRVVKEYSANKPVGTIRVTYSAPPQPSAATTSQPTTGTAPPMPGATKPAAAATQPASSPSLHVECDLFRADVPAECLQDLPRPDWSKFVAVYSLTDYDVPTRKFVDRPYIYVMVPLLGPPGQDTWKDTWVTFHFNQEKSFLDRKVKRFVPEVNSTRVIWQSWTAGKGMSAEDAMKTPDK